jgi:hypothetical protein
METRSFNFAAQARNAENLLVIPTRRSRPGI